jgi:3-deoxy-D-manno-octulosonic acid (KDO) 8-phosphate synthase
MSVLLENEFNPELQLPHANRGTWGGIRLDVRDLARAGCAKAIDTLVTRQSQHGMVE